MLPGIIINDDKGIKVLYDLFFLQNFALSLLAIGKIVKINGVKSSVSDPGFFSPGSESETLEKSKSSLHLIFKYWWFCDASSSLDLSLCVRPTVTEGWRRGTLWPSTCRTTGRPLPLAEPSSHQRSLFKRLFYVLGFAVKFGFSTENASSTKTREEGYWQTFITLGHVYGGQTGQRSGHHTLLWRPGIHK